MVKIKINVLLGREFWQGNGEFRMDKKALNTC